jgi:hypothetical protein
MHQQLRPLHHGFSKNIIYGRPLPVNNAFQSSIKNSHRASIEANEHPAVATSINLGVSSTFGTIERVQFQFISR